MTLMPSFQITLTPNRRAAARFIGEVRRALQKAYVEEQAAKGLSQSDIARALNVHRSVINRELKGLKDLTLGRVGEIAWALGRKPFFSLEAHQISATANFQNLTAMQSTSMPAGSANFTITMPSPTAEFQSMIPPLATAA